VYFRAALTGFSNRRFSPGFAPPPTNISAYRRKQGISGYFTLELAAAVGSISLSAVEVAGVAAFNLGAYRHATRHG
jgi:hypothetical protein